MVLYIEIKDACKTDTIDYLRYKAPAPCSKEIFIDWHESSYSLTDKGFIARCKEVDFDDEYADGRLGDLKAATLDMFECVLNENDEANDSDEIEIVALEFIEFLPERRVNIMHIDKEGSKLKLNHKYLGGK